MDSTLLDTVSVPRNILVIDDDPDIHALLRAWLAGSGYEMESAHSAEQAEAVLAALQPDILLLDVVMPGSTGLQLLGSLREQQVNLAVIMMTASGSEQVAVDALRGGANDYLRKPFRKAEFRAVLDRVAERLLLVRQNAELRRQLDEKRRQLEAELAQAAALQAGLLPREMPVLARMEVAARFRPAREVGGDFYDWQLPSPEVLKVTVGDVMGKGMPAALMMATARAALRAIAPQAEPAVAVRLAEAALEVDLDRSGCFLTLFHGQLDLPTMRLSYVDAGHGYVFLRRADGQAELLGPRGLPLGVVPGTPYEQGSVQLHPGDALAIYSDGLVDARPDLPPDPSVLVQQMAGAATAEEMADRLLGLVETGGPLPDDLTVLVLFCRRED